MNSERAQNSKALRVPFESVFELAFLARITLSLVVSSNGRLVLIAHNKTVELGLTSMSEGRMPQIVCEARSRNRIPVDSSDFVRLLACQSRNNRSADLLDF